LVSEPPRWYAGHKTYINSTFSTYAFVDLINDSVVSIAEALGSSHSSDSEGGGNIGSGVGSGTGGGGGGSW